MTDVNIFDSAVPQSGEFFKFKKVGDSIQGTYIDKQEGVDSFSNDQWLYMIQDKDGKVWNIAFRKEALFVNERMASIKFGQIVGFRFDEERDSKKMPGKKAKIIRIYADNKFINKEWLANQKELEIGGDSSAVTAEVGGEDAEVDSAMKDVFEAPADATPATGSMTQEAPAEKANDAISAVIDLAKTKGLTTEAMSADEQAKAIEEYTKLTMTDENMTKIIIALTGYKK